MYIQFRTLTFHNRLEEQLQERLRLKKSTTSLLAAIGALGSPLEPHLESDLATDLYSDSTPIANMDESNRWISFNLLNKSMISLSVVIGTSDSLLGPRLERDLATGLHSGSTLIAIEDESNRRIRFRRLQKIYNITTRCDQSIELSSRNPSENDLTTDLYSGSALAAHYVWMGVIAIIWLGQKVDCEQDGLKRKM
jgi:hypothetical protein